MAGGGGAEIKTCQVLSLNGIHFSRDANTQSPQAPPSFPTCCTN